MIFVERIVKKLVEEKEPEVSKELHKKIYRFTTVLSGKLRNANADDKNLLNSALTILNQSMLLALANKNEEADRLYAVAKRVSKF